MRYLLTVLFVIPLCAQQPPQEGGRKGGPMPPPTNLKVLKLEGPALIAAMRSFTTALGVKCDHCHVGRDFASDENPKKEIARGMILMARDVNGRFHDEKMHVTCYTCHRGKIVPDTAPPAPATTPGQ